MTPQQKYYQKHKERIIAWNKEWKLRNPDKVKKYHQSYLKTHREEQKAYHRKWQIENKDHINAYHRLRRKHA